MIAFQSLLYWARFLTDFRTQSAGDSAKVLMNKSLHFSEHTLHRLFGRSHHFNHDWAKNPFQLSSCIKWSRGLSAWYVIEDLSSIISMEGAGGEPQEWILDGLLPGMVMIDVGAHNGRYSVCASRKVGQSGLVVAMEPHPRSVQILKRNLGLNVIENVRIFPVACWSERANLTSKSVALLALHAVTAGEQNDSSIPGISLDDLIKELGVTRVDWIKVDVEGSELAVLKGARETLGTFRPNLCLEYHQTLSSLNDWLVEPVYHVDRQTEDPHKPGYGWILTSPGRADLG
jgi:FkbM family methyltransferase